MNWDAIGAVAELLGALGVIASLVYLAAQIRQNTRSVRASTYQGLTVATQTSQGQLAYDPETAEIIRRGIRDFAQLSEAEAFRFNWFMGTVLYSSENAMYQFRNEMLSLDRWQTRRAIVFYYLASPGVRCWWRGYAKQTLDPEFVRLLDDEVHRVEASEGPRPSSA